MKNTADFITQKFQDGLFPSKGQVHSHDNMLNLTSHREQLKKDRMAQQTLKQEQTEKSSSCREQTPSSDKKAADIKKRLLMNNLIKLCSLGALIAFGGYGLYKGGAFVVDRVKNIAKSSSEQGAVITDLHTHQVVVDFSKKKGR